MNMDGVIKIVKPVPDSQFRLLSCNCGSDNVAYVKYRQEDTAEDAWKVSCFDCGRTVDKVDAVQHDAQRSWNEVVA